MIGGRFLIIATLILLGYGSWLWLQPEPDPPQDAVIVPQPAPAVPYLVKAKVRTILEQLSRIAAAGSSGDVASAETRIWMAAKDIRTRLVSDGVHQDSDMLEIVRAAAAQSGLGDRQVEAVAEAFQQAAPAAVD